MQFNSGAAAYTFTTGLFSTFVISGAGIINNSSNTPTFNVSFSLLEFDNSASAGNAIINADGGNVTFTGTSTGSNARITTSNFGLTSFTDNSTGGNATITADTGGKTQFSSNGDGGNAQLIANGTGVIDFSGTTGSANNNNVSAGSIAGSGTFNLGSNKLTVGSNNLSTSVSGTINDGGGYGGTGASLVKTGTGTLTLSGTNTYSGGTTFAGGTVSVSADANLGAASGGLTFNGGTLQVTGTGYTSTARSITWGSGGGGFDIADAANTFAVTQSLTGTGGLTKLGAGTLVLSGTNTYSGATNVNAGTLRAGSPNAFSQTSAMTVASGAILDLNSHDQSVGSLAGSGNVTLGSATLTAGSDNSNTTYSGTMSGTGGYTKTGSGTTTLSGTNTYTGATNVTSGGLVVNGSIASSAVTIWSGAYVGGTGTLGSTTVNSGGTLAPGNSIGTINVSGNLTFNSGSNYSVEVSPTAADRTNVSGTATLAGTVNASFQRGNYVKRNYTILSATGGRSGTFDSLTTSGLGSGFSASLGYTSTDVTLTLDAILGLSGGLNVNQSSVANSLNDYFNNGGALPSAFVNVFDLTGSNLASALTQMSGEVGVGGASAGFQSMDQFLALMINPFGGAPGGIQTTFGNARGFAPEAPVSPQAAAAYAAVTPKQMATVNERWGVWGSAYGGSNNANGIGEIGSHEVKGRNYGIAAGADYHVNADTVIGFALGGGGTNWGLSDSLGSGRSDLLQLGVYGSRRFGQAYVAAALGYAGHNMTTDRTVTVGGGDQLHASFDAQNFGGRLESGYRFDTPYAGITPYAALQAQTFITPAYGESATSGSGDFALSYSGKAATQARSELGAWIDKVTALNSNALLTLRWRAAWAHDYSSGPSVNAAFQVLPTANFTVYGASPGHDAALLSAAAEVRLTNHVTLGAKFDSAFARGSRSYASTGSVRYVW